MENVRF